MNLKFSDYFVWTNYKYENVQKLYLTSNVVSQSFNSGVNFLVGDIDCGWTALAYSITPNAKSHFLDNEKIEINNKNIEINDIKKLSCFLGFSIKRFLSCAKILKRASKIRDVNYKEILNELNFPEWLLDRKPSQLGKYSPLFLSAYYYLLEKKIFVMPWCSNNIIDEEIFKMIVQFFDNKDCITLIPVSSNYDISNMCGTKFNRIENN